MSEITKALEGVAMQIGEEQKQALYDAVQKRPRPEDVAQLVLDILGPAPLASPEERLVLHRASATSAKRYGHMYSSMAADFVRPKSEASRTLKTASTIMNIPIPELSAAEAMDPNRLMLFVDALSRVIAKTYGESTRAHKLTRDQRHAIGMYKNARWYNKRWRILCRLEKKIENLAFNQRRYLFTRVGKSALAVEIPKNDLLADVNTACFVAYYSSRMSIRSTFTNQSQVRAFDEVAEVLLKRCEASGTTRWDLVAHVMPDERVLSRLSDGEKGRLLGRWWALLTDMADMLHQVHLTQQFRLDTMIVSRGNDSSTWNAVAGAWNKAREQWISLLHAMGIESMLDAVCPGKVMRLMAADVASWHRSSGGDVHPDTKVWAVLPPPWMVVHGDMPCTREMVKRACDSVPNSSAEDRAKRKESWLGPKRGRKAVAFTPTPELVHGVVVSSPDLAAVLRKAGVFSGKLEKGFVPPINVVRDKHGAATRVEEVKNPVAHRHGRA